MLRETPGGRLKHFRLPCFPSLWKLDHRFRVDRRAFGLAPGAQRSPNPCDPRSRAGTSRLGPPALGVRVAPVPGHRQPVPLVDASRSALGWTGLRVYVRPESRAGISFYFCIRPREGTGDSTRLASIPARRGSREHVAALRPLRYQQRNAPVAQLDRALPSEGRGQRFESSRARHFGPKLLGSAETRLTSRT